jgi:GntR family transcriptional regulator
VELRIDATDGTPIYLQIVDQIKRSVAGGRLKPEDSLPSVRQLALDLTINPNTVARAYLELEHQGLIYKRQGQGTFVCTQALGAAKRERNKIVSGLFQKAIEEAGRFGMSSAEITAVFEQQLQQSELEKV